MSFILIKVNSRGYILGREHVLIRLITKVCPLYSDRYKGGFPVHTLSRRGTGTHLFVCPFFQNLPFGCKFKSRDTLLSVHQLMACRDRKFRHSVYGFPPRTYVLLVVDPVSSFQSFPSLLSKTPRRLSVNRRWWWGCVTCIRLSVDPWRVEERFCVVHGNPDSNTPIHTNLKSL